ncbi:MAG: NUDIX domain-containing protein [Paracoccaceae bacterium]
MTDIVNGVLTRDGQVLMARRTAHRRTYHDSWSFPGGHVGDGETLEQALVRELREEIGVTATPGLLLHSFSDNDTYPEKPVTFYLFAVNNWQGVPVNHGDEHSELRWMPFDEAGQLPDLTFPDYAPVLTGLIAG